MSRQSTDTCASCESFPIHEAAQNGGAAMCPWYQVVKRFDDRASVLHVRAKDARQRAEVVKQLREALK